ncbi:S1C family serine protease [Neorhodopirellula lusitana]|uniref:S1C family serine protease n=1 Tax=Neorhodopirellula lusitana TaxID=445327 RepID=UPI00384BED53
MANSDSDHGNSILVLVLGGAFASFLILAAIGPFVGWRYYQGIDVAQKAVFSTAPIPASPTAEQSIPSSRVESSRRLDVRLVANPGATQAGAPQTRDSTQTSLKYSWNPANKIVYDFDIEAEVGSQKVKYHGRNTIQGTGKRPNEAALNAQVDEGSGTGFVIHPDGIVVTCAHVVKGATSIQATIAGSRFDAEVIKLDSGNDLAILRLNTKELPFLKFANSDQVRLGQDVRAIGYPLSDLLGKSIKMTKGEVSGRGGPHGTDGMQIDATINPGNSGGPLVDDSGRLVGVTSSMLAGAGISEVGFAVPANKVITLAKEMKIPIEFQDEISVLPAPDIIDLVRPATALLEFVVGPGGVGMEIPHELEYYGYWFETSINSPSSLSASRLQNRHFDGTLHVDSAGHSLQEDPDSMLPWMLGSISRVGIEPLPDSAPGRTLSTQLIVIQSQTPQQRRSAIGGNGFGSFGSRRLPPWMRRPDPTPDETTNMLGTESTTIELGKPTPNGIELTKSYSLKVSGDSDDELPLMITGKGEGMYDPLAGRMLNLKYKMSVTINQENVTLRIPVSLTYKLVDEAQLAKEKKASQERQQARAKTKAQGTPTASKESSFESSTVKTAEASLKFKSVKNSPKSPSLDKFDFDK